MRASISRFSAIASDRAPTIATRDPEQVVRRRDAVDGEERADVRERQREDRVLELDEPVVEARDSHQVCWWCGRLVGEQRQCVTERRPQDA